MNPPESTIKTWTVVGWVFTAVYLALCFWYFSRDTRLAPVMAVGTFGIALLFAAGSTLARNHNFSGAFGCYLAGGILGFPLGLVMIIGAIKVKQAGAALRAPPPPPCPPGP